MKLPLASATSLIALLTFDAVSASAAQMSLPAGSGCLDPVCAGTAPVDPLPVAVGLSTSTVGRAMAGGPAVQEWASPFSGPALTGIIPLTVAPSIPERMRPRGGITSSLATGVTFLDRDPVASDAADEGPIVVTTLSASGAGSTFSSLFRDTAVTPAPAPGPQSATSLPAVSVGTLGLQPVGMGSMALQTTGSAASIGGAADPCVFSVALPSSKVAESANLGILVTGKGVQGDSTTLTIYTDDSVAYGGAGDTFAYAMTAPVPEPMSLVIAGAGLAELAFMRRRRMAPCRNRPA